MAHNLQNVAVATAGWTFGGGFNFARTAAPLLRGNKLEAAFHGAVENATRRGICLPKYNGMCFVAGTLVHLAPDDPTAAEPLIAGLGFADFGSSDLDSNGLPFSLGVICLIVGAGSWFVLNPAAVTRPRRSDNQRKIPFLPDSIDDDWDPEMVRLITNDQDPLPDAANTDDNSQWLNDPELALDQLEAALNLSQQALDSEPEVVVESNASVQDQGVSNMNDQVRSISLPIATERPSRTRQNRGRGLLRAVSALLMLLGAFLLFQSAPKTSTAPKSTPIEFTKSSQPRLVPIEQVRLGQRALGRNPDRSEVDDSLPEPDQTTWREVRLRMTKLDGGLLQIHLLRPLAWIEENQATVGGTILMDLPELGAEGEATVEYVGPCPPIEAKRSDGANVVTGRFIHDARKSSIVEVRLQGETEPIRSTSNHRFWSVSRKDWVEAGELKAGELVDSNRLGVLQVVGVSEYEPGADLVYNLETHGEHVYRVAIAGTLVHNAYPLPYLPRGYPLAHLQHWSDDKTGVASQLRTAARNHRKNLGREGQTGNVAVFRLEIGPNQFIDEVRFNVPKDDHSEDVLIKMFFNEYGGKAKIKAIYSERLPCSVLFQKHSINCSDCAQKIWDVIGGDYDVPIFIGW